jgi:hypothetical protein
MPRSPSIVPEDTNRDVYLVLDDFGRLGRAWRETDEAGTSRATLVRNLLDGQYENPVRIIAFNTVEGWSRDVTVDIADELRRRYVEYDEVSESVLKFLEATCGLIPGEGVPRSPRLLRERAAPRRRETR